MKLIVRTRGDDLYIKQSNLFNSAVAEVAFLTCLPSLFSELIRGQDHLDCLCVKPPALWWERYYFVLYLSASSFIVCSSVDMYVSGI